MADPAKGSGGLVHSPARCLPRNNVETAERRVAAFAPPHYDEAMSFSDTIFLFFLALILFGPKKLPGMARQAGRLLAELRRASNEFKSQIETEIAHLETEKPTILPPSPPPQGTVAVPSGQAAIDPVPQQLESPVSPDIHADHSIEDQATKDLGAEAQAAQASANPEIASSSTPATESVVDPGAPQESHV
ncbi:MAG: twin-arginine translocase TatA/TatE family subunit [Candidatus Sulfotelmatobacter sp.]|jgi:Sec-independent protein translocase protein TatA